MNWTNTIPTVEGWYYILLPKKSELLVQSGLKELVITVWVFLGNNHNVRIGYEKPADGYENEPDFRPEDVPYWYGPFFPSEGQPA